MQSIFQYAVTEREREAFWEGKCFVKELLQLNCNIQKYWSLSVRYAPLFPPDLPIFGMCFLLVSLLLQGLSTTCEDRPKSVILLEQHTEKGNRVSKERE